MSIAQREREREGEVRHGICSERERRGDSGEVLEGLHSAERRTDRQRVREKENRRYRHTERLDDTHRERE